MVDRRLVDGIGGWKSGRGKACRLAQHQGPTDPIDSLEMDTDGSSGGMPSDAGACAQRSPKMTLGFSERAGKQVEHM